MKKIIKNVLVLLFIICLILQGPRVQAVETEEPQTPETTNTTQNSTEETNTNNSISTNTQASQEPQTSTQQQTSKPQQATGSSTSTKTTGNTSSNKKSTTATVKSSNANLSNLGIRPHDFSGFKPEITSYTTTVPKDTEEIEVYAQAQNSLATVTGTGYKKLNDGENAINVTVTAQDGTTKTYTLKVTKQSGEAQETTATEVVTQQGEGDGLAELKIQNLKLLEPEFKADVYEYQAKYIGEATTLNIETKTTDPYYTVDIIGNEELKEGNNLITILVSNPDGANVATYQITVDKSLVDEELIAQEKAKKEKQQKMVILAGGIILLIVAIIIFVSIKRRRKQYEVDYEEDNQEDYDYEYDDEEEKEEPLQVQEPEELLYEQEAERLEEVTVKSKKRGKRFK